ncbi:MAG: VWA domain-containing protein [Terracidiphilus sp.]
MRWFSATFLVMCVAQLYGQPTPEAQSPAAGHEETPGLSTTVNEVSLDLTIHDKRHKAVLDLKPEDLAVTDDGVPVKLTGFRLVSGEAAASRGHMITLMFDPFIGPTARSARVIAGKILSILPTEGYSIAVLDFRSRLRLLQGFTEDRQAVEQAVHVVTESEPMTLTSTLSLAINIVNDKDADADKAKAASAAEKNLVAIAQTGVDLSGRHVDARERGRDQTLLAALNDSQAIVQEQHTRLAFAGLLALVKSQQSASDRKALIYFTINRQLDPASKKILTGIADAAAQAGVTVYTIDMDAVSDQGQAQTDNATAYWGAPAPYDPAPIKMTLPNGMVSTAPAPPQQEGGTPIAGTPSATGAQWTSAQDIAVMTDFMRNGVEDLTNPFADSKSPMIAFSKATGGAYIDGMNPTGKPLQQMVQDLTSYYQASYVPPFKEYDGKFRAIAVKPLRAGLDVQTKTGYFALAGGADGGIKPFEAPLLRTIAAAQLPIDVKFHAAVLRFGDLPDGNSNTLAVEVPLSELVTKTDANSHISSAHVSIVAQIKDISGTVVEHYSQDTTKRGAKETLDRDKAATISMERHFVSAPGKYTMEVAVLDQNSGKAGAQRREFEIPDLTGVVSVSDMVLVRSMAGSNVEEDDPLEPLRYEHQRVTPNLTGELPASAKDAKLFFILHPDPASDEPMKLEIELIRNGKPVQRTPLLQAEGVHAAMPYLANIRSQNLRPGEYEVKAYLSQGAKTTVQSGSFTVTGTPGLVAASAGSNVLEVADITAGTGSGILEAAPHAPNQLAITALPKAPPGPAQDEAHVPIESARVHALSYNGLLPNFICTEVTKRAVDVNGDGKWKSIDTLVELLSYRDRTETRTMLEVNGNASHTDRGRMKGVFSAGEFGGVLQAVFREASKADFQWKETDLLNGGTVQVYNYRVDRGNSSFSVTGADGKQVVVGFSGQVFIDSTTRRARRITLTADGLATDSPTQATSIDVDYDYVGINGLKYLMPVSAELHVKKGQHEALINTMEFREYKRFDANGNGRESASENE